MSKFTTPLIVVFMDACDKWLLAQEFEYHVGEYPSVSVIKVPTGFQTDFASIPRPLWPVLPPTGRYGKAAVLHDYLYSTQTESRRYADAIFLEAMEVLKVPLWLRKGIYGTVRMFGWIPWHHKKKHLK